MKKISNQNSLSVPDGGGELLTATDPSLLLIGSVAVLSVLNSNRITGAGVSTFFKELPIHFSASRAIIASVVGSLGAGISYGAEKFNSSRRPETEDHEQPT